MADIGASNFGHAGSLAVRGPDHKFGSQGIGRAQIAGNVLRLPQQWPNERPA
jgi:hypothetical protein